MASASSSTVAQQAGFTAALSRVWYWALVAGAYSAIVVAVGRKPWTDELNPDTVVDAILALILGLILVFRINRAYERWWEARTLWGKLVNVSRNLAIKVKTLVEPDEMERRRLSTLIGGFAFGLKDHLRDPAPLREVPGFETSADEPEHVPAYIVEQIYGVFSAWRSAGRVSATDVWILDREAREFLEVAGGCERIKNTLMAQSFPSLSRQLLVLYLLYAPWTLAGDFGWASVPMVVVVTYFIVAAEGIASYVERPFGREDDHLDLDSICTGIDASVKEILER